MKRRITVSAGLVLFVLAGARQAAYGQAGAIVGWERNVAVPQEDLTNLVAVAAGWFHSLGLKTDGSVVAWGCGDPVFDYGQCNVPAPSAHFVGVAGGETGGLGLKGAFGDVNVDGRVELDDFDAFADCLSGPGVLPPRGCVLSRIDGDWNVDLADFAILQRAFSPAGGR